MIIQGLFIHSESHMSMNICIQQSQQFIQVIKIVSFNW